MIKHCDRPPHTDHRQYGSDPHAMQPPGTDLTDCDGYGNIQQIKTVFRKSDAFVVDLSSFPFHLDGLHYLYYYK